MHNIYADEIKIGQKVIIEEDIIIRGKSNKNAKRVIIGDNVFIGHGVQIFVDDMEIGDFTIIHNHTLIAGNKPCRIGHCCWIGQNTILNSTGGLSIGNGVGVGAYSQLWSHICHGDILQGCRWNSNHPLIIEDDVWFVGHCIVSPVHAYEKSMALVGSVITKDMEANHVYAGVPAKDVTDKTGPQFSQVSIANKYKHLSQKIKEFYNLHPLFPKGTIEIVRFMDDASKFSNEYTIFDVSTRTYNKRRTPEEVAFMKSLLPLIKFFPR